MSGIWVLGLGASIGYLAWKKERVTGRLEAAIKEYEGAGEAPSTPSPPDGVNVAEIKQAWRHTEDTRHGDFNERLPANERAELLKAEDAQSTMKRDWDNGTVINSPPEIQGVYLEQFG